MYKRQKALPISLCVYCSVWTIFSLRLLIVVIRSLLLVEDSRHYVSTLILDYSVSALFCVGLLVRSLSRQSSAFVDRSLASLHWCDRLRGRVPTFDVEQPLRVNVSYCSRRRLLAVTFDVRCILSTVFDGHSEELFLLAGLA